MNDARFKYFVIIRGASAKFHEEAISRLLSQAEAWIVTHILSIRDNL